MKTFLIAMMAAGAALAAPAADAQAWNNLAAARYQAGDYRQAETLYLRALETWNGERTRPGREAAITMGNLAAVYRAQARFAEAEKLGLESLKILERTTGEAVAGNRHRAEQHGRVVSRAGRSAESGSVCAAFRGLGQKSGRPGRHLPGQQPANAGVGAERHGAQPRSGSDSGRRSAAPPSRRRRRQRFHGGDAQQPGGNLRGYAPAG